MSFDPDYLEYWGHPSDPRSGPSDYLHDDDEEEIDE